MDDEPNFVELNPLDFRNFYMTMTKPSLYPRVILLHAEPKAGSTGHRFETEVQPDVEDYQYMATFTIATAYTDPEYLMGKVYSVSQNIDDNWRPYKPCRSTSVGDLMGMVPADTTDVEWYMVDRIGFVPLNPALDIVPKLTERFTPDMELVDTGASA